MLLDCKIQFYKKTVYTHKLRITQPCFKNRIDIFFQMLNTLSIEILLRGFWYEIDWRRNCSQTID